MLNAQLVQHAYITWGDVQISYRLQGKNRKREKGRRKKGRGKREDGRERDWDVRVDQARADLRILDIRHERADIVVRLDQQRL